MTHKQVMLRVEQQISDVAYLKQQWLTKFDDESFSRDRANTIWRLLEAKDFFTVPTMSIYNTNQF